MTLTTEKGVKHCVTLHTKKFGRALEEMVKETADAQKAVEQALNSCKK